MGLLALAVLAVLLLAPSASFHMFSGLPLASLLEYLGLLALLPVIVWPWLRHRWRAWVAACPAGWLRLAVAALCAGVLLKGALFVAGGYEGFAGCYQAIYRTVDYIAARPDDGRTGLCEKSYDNPLARFSSTRIDSVLDFGPDDWNLSFMNDLRFNFYSRRSGAILRERLPFSVTWRGLTSHPSPQDVTLTYVGHVQIGLIGRGVLSFDPAYGAPRTAEFRLPAGRQLVFIKYTFDDGYRKGMASPPGPGATFRLRTGEGDAGRDDGIPVRADTAPGIWRLAGRAVDTLAVAAATVLALFYFHVIGGGTGARRWRLLAVTMVAAGVVYSPAGAWLVMSFDLAITLALLVPLALVLTRTRQPADLITAWWGAALLILVHEAARSVSLDAVLLRSGGSDYLTYESFARSILNTWSLQGGSDVFYYQPFFRYVRFVEHIVFGDGDVLVSTFARTLLVMAVLYMAWTFRATGAIGRGVAAAAGTLALVLVNSSVVVALIRSGISEYPTWIAFPLCFSLWFRPPGGRTTLGAFLLGLSVITRINQAPGLLYLFGLRAGLALRQRTRGFLLAGGVLAVMAALPAVHNYVYGGRLVLMTTSADHPENFQITPTTYLQIWHDEGARTRVKEQLSNLFFTRRPNRPVWLVFRGLQALWVAALCSVFVRIHLSITQGVTVSLIRRPWVPGDFHRLLVLLTPAIFLAPHLFFQVNVYYPRHIVIGHLAMAAVALYATGGTALPPPAGETSGGTGKSTRENKAPRSVLTA